MSNKMTVKDRLKTYRKHPGSFLVMLLVMLGALLTFSVLLFLIAYILINGVPHIKLSLFEWNYTSENASVVPALINTIVMTILSLLIAVPFGIFSAIFLVEYSGKGNKFVEVIRLTTETLSGIPSIVYGLFGMLFFVNTLDWGFSILAGAFTLSIMILPLIMRTTEEALKSVPDSYREGSFGLGAGKLRTVFRIVLPSAVPGIHRCKETQEKKIMLWGKRYQSRYALAIAFGIRETSISARIHTRNMTLEEIILELLQKEPICFEGKTYNTLVELCAEYQVQPCNVFERLKYGKTLEEAIYLPIRNNGKRYEIVYEGKVYQNAAFLCREYNISKLLVYGQQRYKPEYSFIECFRLVKQLRDECGWPNTEVFAFIPRCKIQGKFYKRISDFASAVGMTRGQIDTYKSRHHHKNMIEALQEMQKDRIPAYKTEYGLLPYSEARKKKYTSKQLEQLEYVSSALPRYPMLQPFDFTQDSMDILLRYEELFQKNPQCKREWRER